MGDERERGNHERVGEEMDQRSVRTDGRGPRISGARGVFLCAGMITVAWLPAACAPDSGAGQTATQTDAQTHVVRHAAVPIVIDGKLDESAWTNAPPLPLIWEKVWERVDGKRVATMCKTAAPTAYAKLLWDDENLYYAAVCTDKDLMSAFAERDSCLWKEDVFELFVKPLADSSQFWEYEWSPNGQVLDILWPPGAKGDEAFDKAKQWNGAGEFAVLVRGTLNNPGDVDEGWQIEARVPFADFMPLIRRAPRVGDVWRGAVFHYDHWTAQPKKRIRTTLTCPAMLNINHEAYNFLKFED